MASSIAYAPLARVRARWSCWTHLGQHCVCLVWSEMSGNPLRTSTFQPSDVTCEWIASWASPAMAASAACDPVAPVPARYNQSKCVGRHPQCLVWSEMGGNLLRRNTFQQGKVGVGSKKMQQQTRVIMPPVIRRRPFRLKTIHPSMLGDTHSAWFGRKWVGTCAGKDSASTVLTPKQVLHNQDDLVLWRNLQERCAITQDQHSRTIGWYLYKRSHTFCFWISREEDNGMEIPPTPH